MTATNHALTGAAIALAVKRPELALPLAFVSHFVLDAIPHYGPRRFAFRRFLKFLIADAALAATSLIVLVILFPAHALLIFGCMAVAVAPDLAWILYIRPLEENNKASLDPLSRIHWTIQWKEFPRGIYVEGLWFVLLWIFIIGKH